MHLVVDEQWTKKEDNALFRFLFFQESYFFIPCNSFVYVPLTGFNMSNYLLKILKHLSKLKGGQNVISLCFVKLNPLLILLRQ